jgi:hypothetical protein
MKTVKTVMGFRKIDPAGGAVAAQLENLLQEHRATLIDKLVTGDLAGYIDYKLSLKATPYQVRDIATRLEEIKTTRIDRAHYRLIFEAVERNDFTSLDNRLFYNEIDSVITVKLVQPELFHEGRQVFFHDYDNR